MQLLLTLTEQEIRFLERMINEMNTYKQSQTTMEDAVHECIKMAKYEESEEAI